MSDSETETLRVHFEDLGKCYNHRTKWYGIDSLWWWVRRLGQLSTRDGQGNWVFSLETSAKNTKPTQKLKAHMFALAFQYTDHWRECAQQLSDTSAQVGVKAEPEEQLLAWLDLQLYVVWKYLSDWTQCGFPFFSFVRRDDTAAMDDDAPFTEDQYLGLRSVQEANEWQLQWTKRGYRAYLFWNAHEPELKQMGLLTRRLMDDGTESGFQRSLAALEAAVRNQRQRKSRRERYNLRPPAPTPLTLARVVELVGQIQSMLAARVKEESDDHDRADETSVKGEDEENEEDEEEEEEEEEHQSGPEEGQEQHVNHLRRSSRKRRISFNRRLLGRAPTKKKRPSATPCSLVSRR